MNKVTVDQVSFEALLDQDAAGIERVRTLRNAEGVRAYMYTDHVISADEHAAWVASLRGNARQHFWVVRFQDKIEGVVALTGISASQRSADWAFYLSEDMQGKGVGGVVEFKLLDLAFGEQRLEKLNCEVLATNPKVVEMHQKFGFTQEGVRRQNVIKNGQRVDVVLLGILPQEWQAARPRFARLYAGQ